MRAASGFISGYAVVKMRGKVNKRNLSPAEKFFLQFSFVKKTEPLALCLYCGKVAPERTFKSLMALTVTEEKEGKKLRLGLCNAEQIS